MQMNKDDWLSLMKAFGFEPNLDTCAQLIKVHAQKHRHYHTAEHINACLRHLHSVTDLADRPHEIALALWFHDAIYKPFSSTNERDSADWAIAFLKGNNAGADIIDRIDALIMATCHGVDNLSGDLALMVDVDLSILGAPSDVYDQYEINIRREYKWVPGFIFKPKRKALLQDFLERPRIYFTEHFHRLWDAQARDNLKRAVAALDGFKLHK